MATDAYKVTQDISIPQPLGTWTDEGGREWEETMGRSYAAGEYVRESDISSTVKERLDSGDLDDFLEKVSGKEADEAERALERAGAFSTVIPEHEVEAYYLGQYGHDVVPRDQLLELRSAGADGAKEAIEASREDGRDERPNLPGPEVPSLAEVALAEEGLAPVDSEHVDVPEGIEQPPGLPVGETLEAAKSQDGAAKSSKRGRRRAKPKDDKSEGDSK